MANSRKNNVLIVDTAAEFNETLDIESVKVVNANAAAQVSTIKVGGSGGTTIYTVSCPLTSEKYEEVCIKPKRGDQCYVTPGADCTVYIYLK